MQNKQRGATLFTALIMLLVMTIIAFTSIKMSTLDLLIAGNEQQKMLLFQETETKLSQLAISNRLNQTFTETGFVGNLTDNTEVFLFAANAAQPDFSEIITSMQDYYPCERLGVGTSMGSNAPVCDLYDFQIKAKKAVSNVKAKHHRGSGKMVPKKGSSGNSVKDGEATFVSD